MYNSEPESDNNSTNSDGKTFLIDKEILEWLTSNCNALAKLQHWQITKALEPELDKYFQEKITQHLEECTKHEQEALLQGLPLKDDNNDDNDGNLSIPRRTGPWDSLKWVDLKCWEFARCNPEFEKFESSSKVDKPLLFTNTTREEVLQILKDGASFELTEDLQPLKSFSKQKPD